MPVSSHDLALGIAVLAHHSAQVDDVHRAVRDWIDAPAGSLREALQRQGRLDNREIARAEQTAARLIESQAAADDATSYRRATDEPSLPLFDESLPAGAASPSGDAPSAVGPARAGLAESLPPTARYRILRRHAGGGLGEVFLARDEELGREVAVKRIREEYTGYADLRARFLLEAEITGMVEHPGIVPVYGRGSDAQDRPFYAMRFIQGETLQEAIFRFHAGHPQRLDQGDAALELRRLLRHFVDVCNALACVHHRGVIHRDLKPENIMLGPYGETFVVDWGLAKIVGRGEPAAAPEETGAAQCKTLRPPSAGSPVGTVVGSAMGTPAYMSPEQAAGLVDQLRPSSDLYGLGAILYAILTGRPPLTGSDPEAMRQNVVLHRFPRPREVRPGAPAPLEAVCLKAMSLDPQQRYASAQELASEIEAWMADEPVLAWREPLRLRAARWVRRHRAAVVGAAAALVVATVSLSVGMALLASANEQVRRSETTARAREEDARWNFQLARSAVDRYLTQVSQDERLKQKDLEPLRRDLLQTASGFYEQFIRQQPDDPDLLSAWGWAHFRLGDITAEIGSKREAIALVGKAIDTFAALAERFPENSGYQEARVRALVDRARLLLETGEPAPAAGDLQTARALATTLLAQRPDLDGVAETLADCCDQSARAAREARDAAAAESALREAAAIRRRLIAASPESTSLRAALAGGLASLGTLYCDARRYSEAATCLSEAATLQQQLVDRNRHAAAHLSGLATVCDQLADLYNRWSEAPGRTEKAMLAALRVRQTLVREHPAVTEYQARLAGSQHALARFYQDANRPADAEKALLAARQIYETLVDAHADVPEFALELAAVDRQLSVIAGRLKQHPQAVRYAEEAAGALRSLAKRFSKRAEYYQRLAVACRELGDAQVAAGKPDDAKKAHQDAVDSLEKAAAAGYFADPARRKQLLPGGPFDALRANETHRKRLDAIAAP